MGFVLDTLLIKDFIVPPVTISSDYSTPSLPIDNREAEFSIQLVFDNGISPDIEFFLEVSNDDVNYAKVTDSEQLVIGDVSGSILFDIFGTGAAFIRVSAKVNSGSLVLQSCTKKAKRRH